MDPKPRLDEPEFLWVEQQGPGYLKTHEVVNAVQVNVNLPSYYNYNAVTTITTSQLTQGLLLTQSPQAPAFLPVTPGSKRYTLLDLSLPNNPADMRKEDGLYEVGIDIFSCGLSEAGYLSVHGHRCPTVKYPTTYIAPERLRVLFEKVWKSHARAQYILAHGL